MIDEVGVRDEGGLRVRKKDGKAALANIISVLLLDFG